MGMEIASQVGFVNVKMDTQALTAPPVKKFFIFIFFYPTFLFADYSQLKCGGTIFIRINTCQVKEFRPAFLAA
jgi:Na+/glutamate symporter